MPLSYADLLQTMRAFQDARPILTAVELNLFTAVGSGASAAEAAARAGADPRATEMLLNALVALGALEKRGGIFQNTPDSARFLVDGSPDCTRAGLMHTVNLWNTWSTLTDCVRAGTSIFVPGTETREANWTQSFIAAMHNNAAAQAGAMVRHAGPAPVRRLLDIGGGSGAYSIAFAQAHPALQAEIFDLPSVLPLARQYIASAGLSSRVAAREGDLTRDDFGSGYDLSLLSAICHMLGDEENQDLLRRAHRALVPGGRLIIRDFILDPDKTSPKQAALFSLNMLVGTRRGASYSESEYRAWLAAAGFTNVTRPDPAGDYLIAAA